MLHLCKIYVTFMKNLNKHDLMKMKAQIEELLGSDLNEDLAINVYVKNERKLTSKKWLFLFQDTEFLLAKSLTPNACKIVMLFRAVCKYENRVDYSAKQITKILGVSRQSVYRGIKELKKIGIILEFKDELDERKRVFYLNPESQWKGKLAKMSGIQAVFDEKGNFQDFKDSNPYQLDLVEEIYRLKEVDEEE